MSHSKPSLSTRLGLFPSFPFSVPSNVFPLLYLSHYLCFTLLPPPLSNASHRASVNCIWSEGVWRTRETLTSRVAGGKRGKRRGSCLRHSSPGGTDGDVGMWGKEEGGERKRETEGRLRGEMKRE